MTGKELSGISAGLSHESEAGRRPKHDGYSCASCGKPLARSHALQRPERAFCGLGCWGVFAAKGDRNLEIYEMRQSGVPVAQLAQHFELSRTRVRAILNGFAYRRYA